MNYERRETFCDSSDPCCDSSDPCCDHLTNTSWVSRLASTWNWFFPKVKKQSECCDVFTIKQTGGEDEEERILEKAYAYSRRQSRNCKIILTKKPLSAVPESKHTITTIKTSVPSLQFIPSPIPSPIPSHIPSPIPSSIPSPISSPIISPIPSSIPTPDDSPIPSPKKSTPKVSAPTSHYDTPNEISEAPTPVTVPTTRSQSRTDSEEELPPPPEKSLSDELAGLEHRTLAVNRHTGNTGRPYARSQRQHGKRAALHVNKHSAEIRDMRRRQGEEFPHMAHQTVFVKRVTFADLNTQDSGPKHVLKGKSRHVERVHRKYRNMGIYDEQEMKTFVDEVQQAIDNIQDLIRR